MRTYVVVGAVVCVILGACAGALQGDPGKETEPERIARLIKQLGDNAFVKREAASRELQALSEVLPALRQAALFSDDPEIRQRAARILQTIAAREAEVVANAELAKWAGRWRRSDGAELLIKNNQWTWFDNGKVYSSGRLRIAEVGNVTKFDFIHTAGPRAGWNIRAIVQRQDANLLLRGTSRPEDDYPRDFAKIDEWTRLKE
jgi:hypothetical protein